MADSIGKVLGVTNLPQMMGLDTLNAVVLGFVFLAAVVIIASNIFYKKKKPDDSVKGKGKDDKRPESVATPTASSTADTGPGRRRLVEEVVLSASTTTAVESYAASAAPSRVAGTPISRGPNNDSVQWIDNVLQWFYGPNGSKRFHRLEDTWITTLNAQAKKTAAEVRYY